MGLFLAQSTYTAESWSALIEKPEDRRDALRSAADQVGCTFRDLWYAFDNPRGYGLFEGDNIAMAAFEVAVAASGSVHNMEVHPLITVEEMTEALGLASKVSFTSPG